MRHQKHLASFFLLAGLGLIISLFSHPAGFWPTAQEMKKNAVVSAPKSAVFINVTRGKEDLHAVCMAIGSGQIRSKQAKGQFCSSMCMLPSS